MTKLYKIEKETLIDIYESKTLSYREMLSKIQVEIIKLDKNKLEFDLIGVDCSIANALRRILINNIPTYAIDKVSIKNNTSVLSDEFLAHRLGLIPIDLSPEIESDKLNFNLSVMNQSSEVMNVTSENIKYVGDIDISLRISKNILICKLAPRQCIDIEMTVEKNTGNIHAKWSPVCPATYRLMPVIEIEDIYDDDAVKLQKYFSKGVIDLQKEGNRTKAVVVNTRYDTVSREVLRHPEFEGKVFIGRKNSHFMFSIETVVLDPVYLVKKALNILINKLDTLKKDLYELEIN